MSRPRVMAVALALAVLLTGSAVRAQSPAGTITPPDAYRAALVIYRDLLAADDDDEQEGIPTVADMQAGLAVSRERLTAERDRLAAITPDPCYADAHAQYLAYADYGFELLADMDAALAKATTMFDILPLLLAAGAELEARFPAFYKPGPSPAPGTITMGGSGNVSDYVLAFDVLNICGLPMPSASPGT